MNAEQWQHIEVLLNRALDLPPAEQRAFLHRATRGQGDLLKEVESLLQACEETEIFTRPRTAVGPASRGSHRLEPGSTVGSYRILHEIGHGGMSTVYLAEHTGHPPGNRVALKLIREGLPATDLLDRFRRERQVLSRLQHPHIVRLLDSGSTDSGAPFLVMEYVDGERLDTYGRGLDLDSRLVLFRKVCAAVHYSHRHGILHRDLKPSNILVQPNGEPKLLDFGVAKLLGSGMDEWLAATTVGPSPMTVAYASPEQIRGLELTPRTDVWALGVLLYGLLTDRRPFAGSRSLGETVERILHQVPLLPSRLVAEETSARGALAQRLRGRLDGIVKKALEKDPTRRYPSAEALANDIVGHLAGSREHRPVPTLRRLVMGVALGAGAMAALAGWLGGREG